MQHVMVISSVFAAQPFAFHKEVQIVSFMSKLFVQIFLGFFEYQRQHFYQKNEDDTQEPLVPTGAFWFSCSSTVTTSTSSLLLDESLK